MTENDCLIDPITRESFPLHEPRWCSTTHGLLSIEFSGAWNPQQVHARPPSLWRYREAIPLQNQANVVSLGEGFTALLPMRFQNRTIWIKQDQLFPTGSYKDRGATVLISKAKELGIDHVVQDSSGNAGCAIAAYCAAAGIRCDIYVPAGTSAAKLAQIRHYGARLFLVPGSRADTAAAALQAAQHSYYASHCWNPFFLHGTKTFAYEIWEQLNGRAPDAVVLPVGNGTLVLGAFIGFNDLLKWGLSDRLPRIIAVQAERCAPLQAAFRSGAKSPAMLEATDHTLAEGIAIAAPVRGTEILAAVYQSGGEIIAVSEGQIHNAWEEMGCRGFYIEPTAAATIAGLEQYLHKAHEAETIVSVFSGHGLKSTGK